MDLQPSGWALVVALLAAAVLGVSKTAVPGTGALGAALMATAVPARASIGLVLPLLLVGDLIALTLYGRHALGGVLWRLVPSVAAGVAVGFALLRWADGSAVARLLGAVLLLGVVLEVARRRRLVRDGGDRSPGTHSHGDPVTAATGVGAGASTMVANAGGPIMTLYLLRMDVPVRAFMGTVTWFFFVVNLVKLPFSVGLGLVTADSLRLDLLLLPGLLAGAALGAGVLRRLPRSVFETVALAGTALAAGWLLVTG